MMTIEAEVARLLRAAYRGPPLAPLRDYLDPNDISGAYAVQAANTLHWEAQGRRIVGRKIGLTAKAVQTQLGVDQPDFGVLFDDMEIPDGGILCASKVLQPKIEAEVAFLVGSAIPNQDVTREEVAASLSSAMVAIEIVDSRIADWRITFADTVADNGSSAFFTLGRNRRALAGLDLWTCGMAMEVNGEVASLGAGAACLGHPLNAVTWLARTLAERGAPLRAGDVVLSGALGPMVALAPGDTVRATIGGLGSVQFTYQDDRA
jgi:2-keto-4-pentenoate hydratase